jgi:cysteine desulfurase / selenocysteine lyase
MNKSLIFIVLLSGISLLQAQPIEVGKHDGGEYCYRIPGSKYGGMYPDLESARSGSDAACSCQIELEDVIDPDYWNNRIMDFEKVRTFFPILKSVVHDQPLIFFDSAATAQMPQSVLDEIVKYYQNYKSNVGRGLYAFAEQATLMFEKARIKVARFIGAKQQEIVFTSGATAAINLVAHIWAEHHVYVGDEIIVSEVEHNANFIPWQQLAKRKGAVLKIVPLTEYGVLDLQALQNALSEKTKLVAVTQQSNILGTTNDIASIVALAHTVGAKVLVDAAQSIAHQNINVAALDCDFLVFSGHKLFGPTGVGVLFLKENLFDTCSLENFGGGMVLSVTPEHTEFKCIPYCLEPGTQPIAQVIGLGAALDFIQKNINFEQAQAYETNLARKLGRELKNIPEIMIMSPIPEYGQHNNLVTFTVKNCHAYDVAKYLDEHGIAVRAGFHCVQPYHDKHGGNASVRVSLSVYNTEEEVDFLIICLKKFLKTLNYV